jgi:hypothetical protein
MLVSIVARLLFSIGSPAQKTVSILTEDGGLIYADDYCVGVSAVVLAHGGGFNKESCAESCLKHQGGRDRDLSSISTDLAFRSRIGSQLE